MITPSGKECPHYYYQAALPHRAIAHKEECRLLKDKWQPKYCDKCPVPEIARANASKYLVLEARINKGFLGLGIIGVHIDVRARCSKHRIEIQDPCIGCPQCNAERPGLADILAQMTDK